MTQSIRVEKFLSVLNDNRKGHWNKQVSFAVKYEQYKELSLHDTILIDHPYSPPAFYKVIELTSTRGERKRRGRIQHKIVNKVICRHEFDAIGYNPPALNHLSMNTEKFQAGDIVSVCGINHRITEVHDRNKLTIKPL